MRGAAAARLARKSAHHLLARAFADSTVGLIIFLIVFLDEFRVLGCLIVRSDLDFRGCSRDVSRGEHFEGAIDFEAISSSKGGKATLRHWSETAPG